LRLFEKKRVEKMFGRKREEEDGEYRKLRNGKSVILVHQAASE
jgi:hypothetical protein